MEVDRIYLLGAGYPLGVNEWKIQPSGGSVKTGKSRQKVILAAARGAKLVSLYSFVVDIR